LDLYEGITVRLTQFEEYPDLESRWLTLQQGADCSFFQSWSWIGCWLECLPDSVEPFVVEVVENEEPIGLAIVGKKFFLRHHIFRSKILFLNETGSFDFDRLTIEHNNVLAKKGREVHILNAMIHFLLNCELDWDELYVSGLKKIDSKGWLELDKTFPVNVSERYETPYYFVDLFDLRTRDRDYLAALSRNTRSQIRRALRVYEKLGAVTITIADSLDIALEFFNSLQAMHQSYWQSKGEPGAFCNDFARTFHRCLISRCIPRGEVQLCRITAGVEEVGYLYSFIKDGYVYFYQSGFNYGTDFKLKPGFICHYLAVKHNLEIGSDIYDFLAGGRQYKRSMSTHEANMVWLGVQKKRIKFIVERKLETVWKKYRFGR